MLYRFQAHTSCVTILYSVVQKLMHGFPHSSCIDSMKNARHCLRTLKYCGEMDPVAYRFHVVVSGFYNALVAFFPESMGMATSTKDSVSFPPDFHPLGSPRPVAVTESPKPDNHSLEYLLTIPTNANPKLAQISLSLLFALCRPWDDPNEKMPVDNMITMDSRQRLKVEDNSKGSNLLAQLDWKVERNAPFSWDAEGLGVKTAGFPSVNCFLGSEEPSGWSPAPDVEIEEETEEAEPGEVDNGAV